MVFNVLFYLTVTKPTRPEKPYILFVNNIKYEVKSKAPFSLCLHLFEWQTTVFSLSFADLTPYEAQFMMATDDFISLLFPWWENVWDVMFIGPFSDEAHLI